MKKNLPLPGKRTILVIVDGLGIGAETTNNAFHVAHTPCFDRLFAHHPHTLT